VGTLGAEYVPEALEDVWLVVYEQDVVHGWPATRCCTALVD
jgi:hypothetical protein